MVKINFTTNPTIQAVKEAHIKRFLDKVERIPIAGCWIWIGAIKPNGYGNFNINGKTMGAHRASYILFRGPFDKNLHVCHRCDNPACVNPDHLFLGTQRDNIQDMIKKGRQVVPPMDGENNPMYGRKHSDGTRRIISEGCKGKFTGVKHPRATITEDDVINVMKMRDDGNTAKEICSATGISFHVVRNIIYRKSWKHVPWPK